MQRRAHRGTEALRVGFVGLGIIGSAFSRHLLAGGYNVCGYDTDGVRLGLLRDRGGRARATAAAVAAASDVVITAVARPSNSAGRKTGKR